MKKSLSRWILYLALLVLYLLHNDFWLWNDARLVFRIPIGLLYHIGFCVAASLLMFALVNYLWPSNLEVEKDSEL